MRGQRSEEQLDEGGQRGEGLLDENSRNSEARKGQRGEGKG